MIRDLFQEYGRKSRRQKLDLFHSLFQPQADDSLLDVGASSYGAGSTLFLEDAYPHPDRITAGTVQFTEVLSAQQVYPLLSYAVFDGCALPFPDKSFDIVYSGAVIEHVGDQGRQEQFAREIMRVGRGWFVTTPNYWYPIEAHYLLPFIQFMPPEAQRAYNRLLGSTVRKGELANVTLLSARGLRELFPTSEVARMRVTFWPETLVAYHVDPARRRARAEIPETPAFSGSARFGHSKRPVGRE